MCTDSAGLAVPDDGLAGVVLSLRPSPHLLPSRLPPRRGHLTHPLACDCTLHSSSGTDCCDDDDDCS